MVTEQVGKDITVYYATSGATHGKYANLVNHAFASGEAIGFCNIMSYTVEENVEGYMGAGRRYPWGIKAGGLECTVHLEGLWVDSGAQQFFINESARTGALTGFAIGASGTEQGVVFSGCRMGTLDVEFDAEGWCTQTVDITALTKV